MIAKNNQEDTTKKRLDKRVQKVSSKLKNFGAKLNFKEMAYKARVVGVRFDDKDFNGESIFSWDIVQSFKKLEKQFNKLEESIRKYNIDPNIASMFSNLPKGYQVVSVNNNEMYPTIKEDGYVIIDTSKREIIEDLHAINYGGLIKVKRLQFDMDGKVNVFTDDKTSLNSHEETVTKSQLAPLILGRVIRVIH